MMGESDPILSVRGLTHSFDSRGRVKTIRGVGFDLKRGGCLALVGESGAGKTTLSRCLLRLVEPTGGQVLFRGRDVLAMDSGELRAFRKKAQIVFQDPFGSLNPRLRAGAMLEEILKAHEVVDGPRERDKRVDELLKLVGLHPDHKRRYPHELSGGQRQRLGIARALSVGPELLILDEPVSALDLSVQAQVLNLIRELQNRLSLTMILVSHDLAVVRQVADRIAVMYGGRIVEMAPAENLLREPTHPYTRGLLESADPGKASKPGEGSWAPLRGGAQDATGVPEGCVYHPRCPHPDKDQECIEASPDPVALFPGREVACWKVTRGPVGG